MPLMKRLNPESQSDRLEQRLEKDFTSSLAKMWLSGPGLLMKMSTMLTSRVNGCSAQHSNRSMVVWGALRWAESEHNFPSLTSQRSNVGSRDGCSKEAEWETEAEADSAFSPIGVLRGGSRSGFHILSLSNENVESKFGIWPPSKISPSTN